MNEPKKRQIGQNWSAILKKAGIPESPGYRETVEKLYPKQEDK